MGSKKSPTRPDPQIAIKAEQDRVAAEQRAAAEAQKQAADRVAADEVAKVKAERDKAIRGGESESDIATRQASTLANPKKQKIRGRRSLVSGAIGSGVMASRETLG